MNGFTSGREACDSRSPENVSLRKIRIDSKGRISIPSDLRRSLGLELGSELLMGFDLERGIILLFCGQDGVICSTKGCGSFSPGANPGSDPKGFEGGDEDEG